MIWLEIVCGIGMVGSYCVWVWWDVRRYRREEAADARAAAAALREDADVAHLDFLYYDLPVYEGRP